MSVPKLPAGRAMVYRPHKKHYQDKQAKYWRPKDITQLAHPAPEQIDNSEEQFGPIKVTAYQIVDEEEDTFS